MKHKNKASYYGYIFGNICRILGVILMLIFLVMIPNESIVVNKQYIVPSIISGLVFYYGFWRTGGIHYKK